ncbi:MAG TPA: aminoacyl-tRNA hydrolase [Candidatus Doudnabacteria bacterium]|nr:aminoacyl-tRNA hydrolase [Candidatus Doudnabacteria bacterium]
MKIVVGLGNPGTKYEQTRHNAGFLALDFFMKDRDVIACQSKFKAQICEYQFTPVPSLTRKGGDEVAGVVKVFLVKPQNYMNLSGQVVREITSFYKVDFSKDLLVIHDEVDLPFGTLRETNSSSAAGHNGVQNLIDELGTKNFARIRIGVESREQNSPLPTDEFVLQKFTGEELKTLPEKVFPEVNKLIDKFLQR